MIIGTAGHIDHGKTALIKALTGLDTDRLKEERERGISIDLGFAHFDADGVDRAGIVDVPGHERFIRNMLAGAHGIDLVLLVVAADDGVMPQTEEHADILHLLGVRHGIVVLTKIDLVDSARRAAVREEIEILLAGTTLERVPMCEVSSVTGEGLADLRAAIRTAMSTFTRPVPAGYFRLPVDRAFAMRGHGLVVTGTAVAGAVCTDAVVRILPGGDEARVRSVQVHGETVDRATHGQRIALNLSGIDRREITRGHVVCDPHLERVTARFDARVELRPAARRPLADHSLVRVYLGTAEVMGKIRWLDGRPALEPNHSAYAQLVLRAPVASCGGDRFILRDQTARATIGGGVVLHPFARPAARRADARVPLLAAVDVAADARARLTALLALESAFAVAPDDLAAAADLRVEAVRELLSGQATVRALPDAPTADAYTTADKWTRLRDAVHQMLERFHRDAPREPGMDMESVRSALAADLPPKVFRAVLAQLEQEQVLVRQDSLVRLPSHRAGLGRDEVPLAAAILQQLETGGFTPPETDQLAAVLGLPLPQIRQVLAELEREGRVGRVAPELYFTSTVLQRAQELVRRHVAAHGAITAAAFRDLIAASRKYSIALLTYFDRTGFTLRVGDVRKVRRP